MHSLLQRQLRRLLGEETLRNPEVAALIAAVDDAYRQFDADRLMLERSLDLSSQELLQANAELRASQAGLELRVQERTGELERALGSLAREMEERLRAQETLTREETKFRLFLEKLPAITYIAEPGEAGRWSFVSPQIEPILGFSPAAWCADPHLWFDRLHPDDRETVLAEERRSVIERDQFSLEYRLVARDGRVVWVHDDAVFLPASGGEPDRVQGVMFDVTERRLLEEQLVHAQKIEAVGQLAGGVAHDFNNLLTAITGFAELLLHRLGEEGRHVHELGEILRAAERAARLTGKLLAFTRRRQHDPRGVELNALVLDLEGLLRRLIGERIQLELVLAPGRTVVRADPTQLEQVVINLVLNARDAMPNGGLVRLATLHRTVGKMGRSAVGGLRAGDYVVLAVTDHGVGMDEETRRHLFEPFFTTKPVGQGTGLGLATAYGIVRQCGGSILVESEPGGGSTFRVLLPLSAESESVRLRGPALLALPGGSERVLLAEDEASVREFAVTLLTDLGYEVTTASDGVEAMAVVDREGIDRFDLLLTDVVMPRMGGAELAARLRARRRELPVLFASGYASDDQGVSELLGERGLFLGKPFTPAQLATTIRRLLDG